MSTRTTTGASRRPLIFYYLGRPAALYIDAMSQRRARPATSASTVVISAKRPVAVVTGAGRGIGRLLTLRLSDGYAVALVARSQQELRDTARLIDISGGRALCLPADNQPIPASQPSRCGLCTTDPLPLGTSRPAHKYRTMQRPLIACE